MSTLATDVAKASYERCTAAPDFFDAFYRNLCEVCPEVAPMFQGTDFERQNRLLRHAIGLLLIFPDQPEAADPGLLTRIAERHSRRDLCVHPALYRFFVDALLATVRRYDPEVTSEIEDAWRSAVERGIEYMKSKY